MDKAELVVLVRVIVISWKFERSQLIIIVVVGLGLAHEPGVLVLDLVDHFVIHLLNLSIGENFLGTEFMDQRMAMPIKLFILEVDRCVAEDSLVEFQRSLNILQGEVLHFLNRDAAFSPSTDLGCCSIVTLKNIWLLVCCCFVFLHVLLNDVVILNLLSCRRTPIFFD